MCLLGVLVHTSSPVISGGRDLVHFAELSGSGEIVVLDETETNAPGRYHGWLWAF